MIQASLSFEQGSLVVPMGSELARWVALSRVKGLGCVIFKKLAGKFADPTDVFAASALELQEVDGLNRDVIEAIVNFSAWPEVAAELRRIDELGIQIVPYTAGAYPNRLRTIADPPPFLYVKGAVTLDDDKAVAIVGSRSASEYGQRVARDLARGLAGLGFTVVSGMARGIDGVSHEAALASGGRTFAVLGSGVDRAYPPEHEKLYERIALAGAVISELPLGTKPMGFNFPARNRLISGLSLGVVIVEATEKSGSLITASLALEQGREVFAVPGPVGSSRSRGTHQLIRQGAKLVECVDDIIEEIAPQLRGPNGRSTRSSQPSLPASASAEAKRVFSLLMQQALHIDEVTENSGLSPAKVSEILLDLELQGLLKQLPGQRYMVVN